jgi:hypothetical protein
MAPAPRWCPRGLTSSQRRRIQQIRAQKLREEVTEKERDMHFNTIRPVIPTKKEWRVKEKTSTLVVTTFDDDMDLLDDDESSWIKGGSQPPIDMDINMVFMLPAEYRGAEEEVAQMCLSPKEVVFKKLEESSEHLKPLYIWGHIDGKPISRMLIDGSAAVKLMSYSIFKKLGREDDELMKTNLTLNGVGSTRWRADASSPWSSLWGANRSLPRSSSSRCKVTIVLFFALIGFMSIIALLLLCINS